MPALSDHESSKLVKMLVAADSGMGKTGALSSLIDAGYNVRILDFDNGLSPLRRYPTNKEAVANNVHFATLRDELTLMGGKYVIKKADAFQRAMTLLDAGGGEWGADIPPLKQWTPQDVLVVDTLGNMGRSCLFMVMALNAAANKKPEIQHYGQAMDNMEKFLGQVTSDAVQCNVIVNTHLSPSEDSPNIYPEALGNKLGPKIARYFDNFFTISVTGNKRTIKTNRDGRIALKCSAKLSDQYEITDGYARLFKDLTAE